MSLSDQLFRAGALAATIAAALAAATAGPAVASAPVQRPSSTAVFAQNDNPDGNAIAAYDRAADGSLNQAGVYSTGGRGGVLGGSVVDHLASQGSLAYDRDKSQLIAVNAGSNTITVFAVESDRLIRRQVLPTLGSFPVSVAVHGDVVYVLNARDGGSIQGYRRVGALLAPIRTWHRALGLDPDATPEFLTTPGQVAFTPDGGKLLVTTKGNTSAIDVFNVNAVGGVSLHPIVTSLPGAMPFATTFDSAGNLAVTEAGPNAVAAFRINAEGTLTQVSSIATGQAATCWIIRVGDTLYASNAGSGTLSEVRETPSEPLALLGTVTTDSGTVDAAASSDGRFIYAQTGAAGNIDAFRVGANGTLTRVGSVTVPGAVGGEGIVAR
jgi:DNA-binding beta-propeller fold protein YncE